MTMSTCKDCLHIDVCEIRTCYMCDGADFACDDCEIHSNYGKIPSIKNCKYFKDRNRFVDLPCKIGQRVFVIDTLDCENCEYIVVPCTVSRIIITSDNIQVKCNETSNHLWTWEKDVFSSVEKAKKAKK